MVELLVAKPHNKVPIPKINTETPSTFPRPYMSLILPDSGWIAAVAMKNAEAIHENNLKEPKLAVMGPDKVAMMVESDDAEVRKSGFLFEDTNQAPPGTCMARPKGLL